jgi:transposase InsO family protein
MHVRLNTSIKLTLKFRRLTAATVELRVVVFTIAAPRFKERHVKSSAPGKLLCQDTMYIGQGHREGVSPRLRGDTYGSYAFGFLNTGRSGVRRALLHNDALTRRCWTNSYANKKISYAITDLSFAVVFRSGRRECS